jgi:DNA-binding response OmpR family regulator
LGKRILAVDDDPAMRALLVDYLSKQDYYIDAAADGAEMRALLQSGEFDLILLDVRMPGEDGFALMREVRKQLQLPIIMLTGQGDEVDRVLGLELGADDYLCKPFSPRELLARIRAVMRRHELSVVPGTEAGGRGRKEFRAYLFAGWELNTGTRRLISPNKENIELSNAEYSLLVALVQAPRMIQTRDQLISATHTHVDVFDRSIDVQILRLRRKIEKNPTAPEIIRTERGVGYFFDSDVTHRR